MSAIIRVYANLVRSGAKTLDEIPAKIRLAVESYIEQLTNAE